MKKKNKKKIQPIEHVTPEPQELPEVVKPSLLSRIDLILNIFIIIGVLAVLGIGGYLAFSRFDIKLPSFAKNTPTATPQKTTTIDGISVKADLTQSELEPGILFLKKAMKPDLAPTEITLQTLGQQQAGKDISYIGSWNKNGTFISFLTGLSPQNMPAYYRVWMMPPGESVTQTQAQTLIKDIFTADFIAQFTTPLTCRQLKGPDTNPITECAVMRTTSSGDLIGLTVRAPMILEPPPNVPVPTGVPKAKVIIVSACMVPKDATSVYPASICI